MTKINNLLKLLLLVMVINATTTEAFTVKLGSLAPAGSPWDNALRKISAEWKTLSKGKIVVKIYSGGIAGDENDMLRKIKINTLQASAITGIGLSSIFSGVMAVQLPLFVRNNDELNYVIDKMRPKFEAEIEKKGFKVLIWTKVGWVRFFTKKPVITPDDLRKQKLWLAEGDADGAQAWKNAGFNPVPLSTNDIMTSLQSGMVEGITATPLSVAAMQWFGLANNMCEMDWAPLLGGIVISTKTWNKFPKSLQDKLASSAKRIGDEMQTEIDKADAQAIEIMKKHGLKTTSVPEATVTEWKHVAEEAYKTVVGKSFDKASYEEIQKYLVEYRALKK